MFALLGFSALGLSAAGAQTWAVEGPFRDEFLGCTRSSSGQVQCAMRSSYTGSASTYYGATYYAVDTAAYAPDRKRYIASRSSIDGRDVSRANVNVSKASPVTVVYTFDYPKNFDRITMLFIDSGILKDVPIKAGAPAQATPQAAPPAPAPQASAQPAPPAPANPTLSNFDIKLTDCTLNSQGGYTCKGAELIPRR